MPHEVVPAPLTMKCIGCGARYPDDEDTPDRCLDQDCGGTLVRVLAVIKKEN